MLVLLFLFAAFRYEVGCDWVGYYYQYNIVLVESKLDKLTLTGYPLWWAIIELLIKSGFSYPWLNVIAAVIFFGGVHVLARRQPDPLAFLILLFPVLVLNMPMSGIRQGAAIGVICVALSAFIEKRLIAFCLLTALAATLHSSALIFLLLAPMVRGSASRERVVWTALLAIPGLYILMNTDTANLAMSRYFETGVDAAGGSYRILWLALSGLFFVLFLRRRWFEKFHDDYRLVTIGAVAMMALLPLLSVSTVIADRLGYYLVPIQAMTFSRIPYLGLGRTGAVYSIGIYTALIALFVSWASLSDHFEICYVPYNNWLFETQKPYFVH